MMKNSPFISVLKVGNFRNLWLGQIFSQIALNMLSFVLAIMVYQQTQSNTAVSLLILTFGIPAVILGIVAGGVVDHFDKRDVLVICNLSRVFLFILFYFAYDKLLFLYIIAILFSVVTQAFIPAEAPSIPLLVGNSLLLAANSLFTISFYLSTFLGFIFAGPVLRIFGMPDIYLFMLSIMLAASFFVYRLPNLKNIKLNPTLTVKEIQRTINEGMTFIKGNKKIRQSLILLTFAQALIMTLSVLAPGFAYKVLNIDLRDSSYLIMGPVAIGLVIGALIVGFFGTKLSKSRAIYYGIVTSALVMIILSIQSKFFVSLGISLFMLLVLGISNSFITVPSSTILQQYTQGSMRGRIYGVLTALTGGVSILPVVGSGLLADFFGASYTLFVIGVIIMLAGIYERKEIKIPS